MDYYMEEAFREALKAYTDEEVPVGAVIIKDGMIIARAHNRIETHTDVTSHAEVLAIREAQRKMENRRLTGAIMYVTLEPCLMCMGAILHSRISELHIGTRDEERGAVVSRIPVVADELLPNNLMVCLHEDETCKYLLQRFFRELRKTKK